jgi:peptidoglycan/LPS O-acetylase OafA/YrhL
MIENGCGREEYQFCDIFKLILALLVVAIHAELFPVSFPDIAIIVEAVVTSIAVPIFFIFSGYFIGHKYFWNGKDINVVIKFVPKNVKLFTIWMILYTIEEVANGYFHCKDIWGAFFARLHSLILLSPGGDYGI